MSTTEPHVSKSSRAAAAKTPLPYVPTSAARDVVSSLSYQLNGTERVPAAGRVSREWDTPDGGRVHTHYGESVYWIALWLKTCIVLLVIAVVMLAAELPFGIVSKLARLAWKLFVAQT